ncbi:MAG: hypothetical protein KDB88_08425 [Flavobacteriales bacterium]|nr:hypothetical protein [Flavobacteriales bacterium]
MSRSIISLALMLCSSFMNAQSGNANDCVVKVSSSWGQLCEKCEYYKEGYKRDYSGTYQIELRNDCSSTVELKVAVQEENGVWRTFPVKALEPHASMTAFACKGSGKYLYWVRRLDDTEIILPSDQQIITQYRSF